MGSVTVVIATYNQAAWISRTLHAVASQTRLPDQVVVVDDGSTDNTAEVVTTCSQDLPLLVVELVRQPNGGPGAARNRGIAKARGEILAFTDSDAIPRPTWLEEGLKRLEREGDECAGVEGRVEDDQKDPPTIRTHQIHNLHGGRYLTCNAFYRRALVEQVGGFHTRFREDSDLAFSLLEAGYRIVFEPLAIVDHPPREGSVWEVFRLAKKRRNDALLWSRHRRLAHAHLGSLYPPSEILVLVGELAVLSSLLLGALWAIIGLVFILVGLPRLVLASLEGRQYTNRDYLTVLIIGLALPAVNFYYRTSGALHKPATVELPQSKAEA